MRAVISTIKKSCSVSLSLIAWASTIAGIWGYTIKDINNQLKWWQCFLILLSCFFVLFFFFFVYIWIKRNKKYEIRINGKRIVVRVGDLFEFNGWKLIPCNETFETTVDDIVIAHSSLNGQMIDRCINDDNGMLIKTICESKKQLQGNDNLVPLGKIITYKDYMLLSFAHINNDKTAYLTSAEYMKVLIDMWLEMRRVYASKPVFVPLVGAGITNISGMKKDYTEMLKYILFSLKSSNFQPDNGITIVLTKETMSQIDMNVIRDELT